ncbi:SPAC24B11.05 [Cucurbita argyrosperma subsp. argyrosperma]|nr:SPAC24B11.05 [Cucurbita argyrosperma subsp. argyrosperma]
MDASFDCLIFDLDDTLYPFNTGISAACKKNIEDFLVEKCGFPETQAPILRTELFKTYGSTLAGLRALGYDIHEDDYHGFVHGRLPYDRLKQDIHLPHLLLSIPQRKIIFTNSDMNHATEVNLPKATRPDEFPVLLKPSMDAMRIAIDVADVDPRRTLFLDDNAHNIAAGLRTVLVGKLVKNIEADYAVETVHNLAQEIPEIWVNAKLDNDDEMINHNRNDVDSILLETAIGA